LKKLVYRVVQSLICSTPGEEFCRFQRNYNHNSMVHTVDHLFLTLLF
jgi:hypothetical protein